MNELNCRTQKIDQLSAQIYRVRLVPKDKPLFDFKGGQYLYLLMSDGKRIPLSIASPPEEKSYLELHIRLIPGHQLAADMLNLFKTAKNIHIEGPYGQCFLQENSRQVVIIAGGTGFSPMKSLFESALSSKDNNRHFRLYLGAESPTELYQTALIEPWKHHQQLTYIPVVTQSEEDWNGATGFPHEVAISDLAETLNQCDFYISGSPNMVMNVYQALLDKGVSKACIFSDMLDIKRELGEIT